MNLRNPKEIKKVLRKTGFPLEVAVMNVLNSLGVSSILPSDAYLDGETGKSRELDIHALEYYPDLQKIIIEELKRKSIKYIVVHYIIQCKKLDNKAWVFFDNEKSQYLFPYSDIVTSSKKFPDLITGKTFKKLSEALKKIKGKNKIHRSFTEIPKPKPKEPSGIYEEIVTTIKPLIFHKNKRAGVKEEVNIFWPIIVIDGVLWSASLKGAKPEGKIILKKTNVIILKFSHLLNKKVSGGSTIFIISEKYLATLIKRLRIINEDIYKIWKQARTL